MTCAGKEFNIQVLQKPNSLALYVVIINDRVVGLGYREECINLANELERSPGKARAVYNLLKNKKQ